MLLSQIVAVRIFDLSEPSAARVRSMSSRICHQLDAENAVSDVEDLPGLTFYIERTVLRHLAGKIDRVAVNDRLAQQRAGFAAFDGHAPLPSFVLFFGVRR